MGAATQWNVVNEAPASGSTPPPSSSSPWDVVNESATPAAPPQESGGLGALADKYLKGTPEEQEQGWGSDTAAGFVKSAGQGLGGLLDLVTRKSAPMAYKAIYKQRNPGKTDADAEQDYQQSINGRIEGHLRDAAKWLRTGTDPHGIMEHVGAIGEQALEYMSGDALLKMVTTGLEAGEGLKAAQQTYTTLKNNKKVAGLAMIGL